MTKDIQQNWVLLVSVTIMECLFGARCIIVQFLCLMFLISFQIPIRYPLRLNVLFVSAENIFLEMIHFLENVFRKTDLSSCVLVVTLKMT